MPTTDPRLLQHYCGRGLQNLLTENIGKLVGFQTLKGQEITGENVGVYRNTLGLPCLIVGIDGKDQCFLLGAIISHTLSIDSAGALRQKLFGGEGKLPKEYRGEFINGVRIPEDLTLKRLEEIVYDTLEFRSLRPGADWSYGLPPLPKTPMAELEEFYAKYKPPEHAPILTLKDKRTYDFVDAVFDKDKDVVILKNTKEGEVTIRVEDIIDFVCLSKRDTH